LIRFTAPALRLQPSPAATLRSLPSASPIRSKQFNQTMLACRSTLFRVLHSLRLAPPPSKGAPLLGFWSSSAPCARPATYLGIPTPSSTATSAVPPRLRGHPSSLSFPGLFHPGSTPEVHSSGVSPRTTARQLSHPSYPLAVATVATAIPSGVSGTRRRNLVRLQGFALRSSPFSFPLPVKGSGRPFPS
jgi:hypothetical protein